MEKPQTYHIALGSNTGDKFKNLQKAIDAIYLQLGSIRRISKVYKSVAMGFEGDDFFNCCLVLESYLSPKKVLKTLLEIETSLGRIRHNKNVYEARTIDLDIIFCETKTIQTQTLQVPHPEMHNRKFVLQPLCDMSPQMKHPKFDKDLTGLLADCKDDSVLEPINIWLKNPVKAFHFSKFNYLVIEGNIGAGKTSLARMIAQEFHTKLMLERFKDNPFLPKFYEDASRYAFPLEMSFLADRYQQVADDLSQMDLFKDCIVSDYDVFKSLIFSKVTLQEEEFKLYKQLFNVMYKDLKKPDLYVYLSQRTEQLQKNIKKRGRSYEQNMQQAYLEKINSSYLEFLKNQTAFKVKIIDISHKDFVANRADYLEVLATICQD